MQQITISAILFTIAICAHAQQFHFGTSTNPDGHTVTVDRYGLMFDGSYAIPVMGEIHYTRVPESDWRREIRKMKAGGITILSTYVFWIHHEEEEGVWNWSGNRNLHRFLEICKDEQMPVVLRIGPFCHGEVYQGGFPTWIVQKATNDPKQFKLRSQAPGFIAAAKRLYSNIYAQANDMLWKNGGTVIAVQIENECRGPWSYYKQLKNIAVEVGFDVPFYTRTGWPKLNDKEEFGEMLPLYGDYADGFWDRTLDDMPGDYRKAFEMKDTRLSAAIATEALGTNQDTKMDASDLLYPYLTCELGGGMMPSYHRRINISGHEILPLAICKLGEGSNLPGYYMYHGGTNPNNPKHTMGETQTTTVTNYNDMPYMTYDFQAPLGEMGQPNETAFHESRWLHQFLADWGSEFATSPATPLKEEGKGTTAQRGAFVFHNDYVRILHEQGTASVTPRAMQWEGLTITSDNVQPFAKINNELYLITVPNKHKHTITINNKTYTLKPDKTLNIKGKAITLLSPQKARTAFVIDHKMHFASQGGILYKGDNGIVEETWQPTTKLQATFTKTKEADGLRTVVLGTQKVAAMPTEADFSKAAVWTLQTNASNSFATTEQTDDYFLSISYQGDVARVYADGKLVADNFWNGKPMLVRMADLIGKHVELRILPLGKDYPIYLQQTQRALLDKAPNGILLSLDNISVIKRTLYL